jgi:hypothetical protein
MKKALLIAAVVFAVCSSCEQDYTSTVTNNSGQDVSAVLSSGETLVLPKGKSDEIDRWDSIRDYYPRERVSLKTVENDYEFYNTDPIALEIHNLIHSYTTPNDVKLYTEGTFDNYTNNPPESVKFISFSSPSPADTFKIFTTTPDLRATVEISGDEYPLIVSYAYDPDDNTIRVTIR